MASGKTSQTKAQSRTAITVLGMHRSGTSLLTRVLNLMGADLPHHLISASKFNPTGYWESSIVRDFNDRVLQLTGTRWDDWRALPDGWARSPKVADFAQEATGLLESEFGASGLFVMKDPRMSRLVPFWTDIFEANGIRQRTVLALRNPIEVAASLARRNGFKPELSYLLWLRYMLQAERDTRGTSRVVVSYDSMMENWAGTVARVSKALDLTFPRGPAQISAEVGHLISPDHRHHKSGPDVLDSPIISTWLRDGYAIFDHWARNGERKGDYGRLDAIYADLDTAAPIFAPLLDQMKTTEAELAKRLEVIEANQARIKDLANENRAAQAQLEKVEKHVRTESARADCLSKEIETLALERANADAIQARIQQKLQEEIKVEIERGKTKVAATKKRLLGRLKTLDTQLGGKAAELEAALEQNGTLNDDLRATETHAQSLSDKLDQTQSALAQKDAELGDTHQAWSDAKAELDAANQQNQTLQRINGSLKREADLVHAHVSTLREKTALMEQAHARSDADATRMRAEFDAELGQVRDELAAAKTKAATGHSELAHLTNMLMQSETQVQEASAARVQVEREREVIKRTLAELEDTHEAERKAAKEDRTRLTETQAAREAAMQQRHDTLQAETRSALAQAQTDVGILRAGQADILAVLAAVMPLRPGRFWRSGARQLRLQKEAVLRTGLFDAETYLQTNTDVRDTGMDALTHYVLFGLGEGRPPRKPVPAVQHDMSATPEGSS